MKVNEYRTEMCGLVTESYVGKELTLSGWVDSVRDHGGVLFIDLRDETGIIQLVCEESKLPHLTKESVIRVTGTLRFRNESEINEKLKTGALELVVQKSEVLNKCVSELPFDMKSSEQINDELKNKYRYLYLRSERMKNNIKLRSNILHFLRNKMYDLGFTEIQTPILTASSPEGARDFLVPSRKFKGEFYALPQAPQIFKQLLMTSGVNKYFQVAPCFRDEDTRADRTLEFYQLDFEMAFATEEDIEEIGEDVFYDVFSTFSNKTVSPKPFRKIPYREAMLKYGTDKPDLRNPLEITDLTSIFENTTFGPFKHTTIRGIKVEGISSKTNSWFNEVVDYATSIGMPGIGYIKINEDLTFNGPIDKYLSDEERKNLIDTCNLKGEDVLFFIADKVNYNKYAGLIRTYLGNKLELIDKNRLELCIINDFPMFEYNEETKKYDFGHNPFSMPKGGMEALETQKLDDILANQFDFVCNGYEMASGAVRNYNTDILVKAFSLVGYDKSVVETKFTSLYHAFKYGAPPHAGMAPGIDRVIMLITDEENLREVQAFPPMTSGQDLLMGSPSKITEEQLREVHIKIRD